MLQLFKKLSVTSRNKMNIYPNLIFFRNIFLEISNIVLCASSKGELRIISYFRWE